MFGSFDNLIGNFNIMVQVRDVVQHFLLIILVFWILQLASLYFYGPSVSDETENKIQLCMEDKVNLTQTCRPQCQHGFYR